MKGKLEVNDGLWSAQCGNPECDVMFKLGKVGGNLFQAKQLNKRTLKDSGWQHLLHYGWLCPKCVEKLKTPLTKHSQ